MSSKVTIKGIKEGLLVNLPDGDWETARVDFLKFLNEKGEFLRGGKLAIDVGNHVLKASELGALRNDISDRGLILWAVLSEEPATIETAKDFGLETTLPSQKIEVQEPIFDTTLHGGENAIFVQKTLRSGFSLQFPGHITILGDVNPGAEVIAIGNIVVWGRILGMVHAGAEGDHNAVVCALDLSPTQLRVAGEIATKPKKRGRPKPEIAMLVDGKVVVEEWKWKKRK